MLHFLGFLNAAPLTLLGLLVAAIGRVRFLGMRAWVLEFEALPGGLVMGMFRRTRTCGATYGCVVLYDCEPAEWTRRHEHRHALQCMIGGALWPVAYLACGLWALARFGNFYWQNALEVDARAHQGVR